MASCDLCGEKAGWFQNRHPACVTRAENVSKLLKELVFNGTVEGQFHHEIESEAKLITDQNRVSIDNFREAILQAANDAASQLALEAPVDQDEYRRVFNILQGWGIQEYLKTAADYAQRRWFGGRARVWRLAPRHRSPWPVHCDRCCSEWSPPIRWHCSRQSL